MRLRPIPPLVLVAFAALALLAAGCSPKKLLKPNVAPTTRLFVHYDPTDTLLITPGTPPDTMVFGHTVHHVVHLYWFGSDPDGFVAGYDIRFIWPNGPADPPWTRTTRTDSLFLVPDTTGISNPTFEVRAVDNEGLADPNPQRQDFSFSNQAPVVTLIDPPVPAETTLASQTLDWKGVDPDGDAHLLTYYVWLDGRDANPHVTTATELTFPSSDFIDGSRLRFGLRRAFVQAVDPGGRRSGVVSASWQVRPAVEDTTSHPHLLLIDDVRTNPGSETGNSTFEAFYNNAINRSGIGAGYRIMHLGDARFFRSTADLAQTFKLFDAVVWYRGQIPYGGSLFDSNRDSLIVKHQDGIAQYLDAGGKFYLESPDLIRAGIQNGLLTLDFMRRYLGSDFLFRTSTGSDSTYSWPYTNSVNGVAAWLHTTIFADSLKIVGGGNGVRVFGVRDTNNVVLWARAGTLAVSQTIDAPVAVLGTTPAGGIAIASGIPALFGGGPTAGGRFIDHVFRYLGIKP